MIDSWDFIRDTLHEAGLNSDWIRNIMACIETFRMPLLWNGSQLDWFNPRRGISQGDMISPYLFVICIEPISHIIVKAVLEGRWKVVKVWSKYITLDVCSLQKRPLSSCRLSLIVLIYSMLALGKRLTFTSPKYLLGQM